MHKVSLLEFQQNYARLKRRDRRAVAVEELSDAEIDAVRRAEPPPEAAAYDKELERISHSS